jgi:hypothetical protein
MPPVRQIQLGMLANSGGKDWQSSSCASDPHISNFWTICLEVCCVSFSAGAATTDSIA